MKHPMPNLSLGAIVGLITLLVALWRFRRRARKTGNLYDADLTDPPLFKKFSTHDSYEVKSTGFTYPGIRTVFHAHAQASKLPSKPRPLPLLVFIHGLGGCAAQFAPLLTSLLNTSHCLLIDLPGCGLSKFAPQDWEAHSPKSLVQLLSVIIERHRDVENSQSIVLIGHSMGCSLNALLASSTYTGQYLSGIIAMCPRTSSMSLEQEVATRRILRVPGAIFDLMRRWDRKGGVESRSVRRMVGDGADAQTKTLQLRFNTQSKTPVWRRMTHGLLPKHEDADDGLPTTAVWRSLNCPVYLIAGESDPICPPTEVHRLATALQEIWSSTVDPSKPSQSMTISGTPLSDSANLIEPRRRVLKTSVLPTPASHALPYSPGTVRTLSGLIQQFLATSIDPRLSLGWQLTYLSVSGKWDVKNLVKWQNTVSISTSPIGQNLDRNGKRHGGIFMAMKTMREVDDVHTPKSLVKTWRGKIEAVVDISHESPVYNPKGLEDGGIQYHKFPSVSKLPPTDDEVSGFEDLVDHVRGSTEAKGKSRSDEQLIAVHCHYGFNRTGFFIICYLVDRMGWHLEDAIHEFARCRAPGIKHNYFIDALFVRYARGLE